jgi:hypothetical protein
MGALACLYLARSTGSAMLLALAYAGFFLNLFNLIPLYRPSPLLILMAVLALPNVMKAWRGIRSPEEQAYYGVGAETRLSYAALYLGLAAFLAIMYEQLHAELPRAH